MVLNFKNILAIEEEGSSLIAVLIVITIISFLVGSVLMGAVIQNRFIQRDLNDLQARYSAEAGLFHFLAKNNLPFASQFDSLKIELTDSNKTVIINAKPFGGFLAVTSSASTGDQKITLRTLIGKQANLSFKHAIVLGDVYSALNLAGRTSINGDIAVGPLGIKESTFNGGRFKGSVEGKVILGEDLKLPEFDKSLFNYEINFCDSLLNKAPSEAIILEPGAIDLSKMKISEKGQIFFSEGNLEITASVETKLPEKTTFIATGNLRLGGKIKFNSFSRFISGNNLTVSGEVSGRNGLFYAFGDIVVNGKGSFSAQLIGRQKIILLGNSYLRYPSVVYLKGFEKNGIRKGRLELSDKSIVEGTLIIPSPEKMITEDDMRLVIGKQSIVRGGIYNTAQSELHGAVFGTVMTMQFYFYHSPTVYINWLKDTTINVKKRPNNYVVPMGFSAIRKFGILEWQEV